MMRLPVLAGGLLAGLLASLLLLLAACSGSSDSEDEAGTPAAPTAETTVASAPSPAPTSAPAGPLANGYTVERAWPEIAYSRMVGLHFFPDDPARAVVLTQREGIIRSFALADPGAASVLLDLGEKLTDDPGNEEGLLGFAFAPDYAQSRRIFVHYSAGDPRRSVFARYEVQDGVADPSTETIILEVPQPYANHNGGALVFGPDGMLYVALGDGGLGGDPEENGQDLDALLGKILRIDVSGDAYTVPPDNPFIGRGRGEVWAYGWRNPWRITFDRETGDLWAGDVGQQGWEEVNRVIRGGNYGWNLVEGPDCFAGDPPCEGGDLIAPRAYYPTSDGCAITGGYVYRGSAMPELDGWYVYADYCTGRVWALDASSDTSEPVVLIDHGDPIVSFAEDPDGELYLVTFANAIVRLIRAG